MLPQQSNLAVSLLIERNDGTVSMMAGSDGSVVGNNLKQPSSSYVIATKTKRGNFRFSDNRVWLLLLLLAVGDQNTTTALILRSSSPALTTVQKHHRCGGLLGGNGQSFGCLRCYHPSSGRRLVPSKRRNRFALLALKDDNSNNESSSEKKNLDFNFNNNSPNLATSTSPAAAEDAAMRREFDRIDTMKKGEIDKEDISNRLALLPMSIVDQLFAIVDINNDGKICFEEYKAIRKEMGVSPRIRLFDYLNLPIVEIWNAAAVVLCSFLVAVSTLNLPPVPVPDSSAIRTILCEIMNLQLTADGGSVDALVLINGALELFNIIFAFDFFVRWYANTGDFKLRYLTKPLVVLDVVVVLIPLSLQRFFPFVTVWNSPGLQNLLLLRILRLNRVLSDINTFSRFEIALGLSPQDVRPFQLQLARVLLSVFTLLSVSSGLIYTTEHGVNPDIPDYFAALYFSLTTLTTVGFGDIAPITPGGRLVVSAAILAGVAVIPAQAASLLEAILEFQDERKQQKEQEQKGDSMMNSSRMLLEFRNEQQPQKVDDVMINTSVSLPSPSPPVLAGARRPLPTETEVLPPNTAAESPSTGLRQAPSREVLATTTATAAITDAVDCSVPVASQQKEQREETPGGKCCPAPGCERIEHRKDAGFCWSCGSELLRKK